MQAWSPKSELCVTLDKLPFCHQTLCGRGFFPTLVLSDAHAWHWTLPMRKKIKDIHFFLHGHKEEVNNWFKEIKAGDMTNRSTGGQAGRHNVKGCVFVDSCVRTRVFRNRLTLGVKKHWENTDFHTLQRRRKPSTVQGESAGLFFYSRDRPTSEP